MGKFYDSIINPLSATASHAKLFCHLVKQNLEPTCDLILDLNTELQRLNVHAPTQCTTQERQTDRYAQDPIHNLTDAPALAHSSLHICT